MIKVIYEGREYIFEGDELTSPLGEAVMFLNKELEKEMVV